jgi:hypothetical protein
LVNNSLRFRASASATLSRTPTTASNRKTWTWSGWVKRGTLTSNNTIFNAGYPTVSWFAFIFGNDDTIQIAQTAGSSAGWKTAALFRDPSAWYHVVCVIDTTSATSTITSTSTDRIRLYVNGVQYALSGGTVPTQNSDLQVNNTISHTISGYSAEYYDGEMTEINFIDGQALTPNSFGTFNSYGVWQPITYGGSYGTNGFYLPFTATQSYTGIFSGSSQWVSVPNLAAYNVGTSNYTVEGWFYFNTISSQGLFGCDNGSGSTPKFLGLINSSGAILLEFTTAGGATFLTSSSGVVTTGKWYHIAWVRNSGTSTIYVNGTSVGSTATSVNLTGLTQAWNIGYIGEAGPSSLNGYASNFRLVTGTAVYTANFVPQTTPLTAISGTQILTLQNATLVDNSTNAQTVTNTGGVTTGATYPFAYIGGTVKDFGSAGNNWTANNIGFTTGSTLDEMTDVPTLTSATAANYATLNPLQLAGTNGNNPSDGNITVNSNGSGNTTKAFSSTIAASSGKFYAEFTISQTQYIQIAAADVSTWVTTYGSGLLYGSGTISWDLSQLKYYINSTSSTATGITGASNDVLQIAFDADTRKVWFGRNNTWNASGNPAAGTNQIGIVAGTGPLVFVVRSENMTTYCNFGQQPFVYTAPTNFVALNTYNI